MTFNFYLLTFLNISSNRFSIISLSHLNIISSFIIYSLFILFLTTIFFNEKCYVHNIFRNIFTKKFMWKVITSSNLNPPWNFFFFFYLPILTNNDLLPKIYYENIVKILCSISQLGFFILYIIFPFFHFTLIHTFHFFFFYFFSPPDTCPLSLSPLLLFCFSSSFKNIPACSHSLFFSPALSFFLFFFSFLLDSRTFTSSLYKERKEV